MSLYNALFGVNSSAPLLKAVLGLDTEWRTGRFRDIYLNDDGTKIVLYTRNGGGNREHWDYQEGEEGLDCSCPGCCITYHLPKYPNYVRDWDDDFDNTYAYIEFAVPDEWAEFMKELARGEEPLSVSEKFIDLIATLDSGESTPETQRAIEVGQQIFNALQDGKTAVGV